MACNFILKKTPTKVSSCECLKMSEKNFLWNTLVAASENGLEQFLRISKGGLTWNNLYDLTNLNV